MKRSECTPEENVLRAIQLAHYDPKTQKISSSLFRGQNISVSRLAVYGLYSLFEIFHRDLKDLQCAGEINVRKLKDIGKSFLPPMELTVEKDPLPTNKAHAEIPQKISRSLSIKIKEALILHLLPN